MIELKNITFSYEGREQGGLRNINLTVKNGECILLCGRSGCGKTTITRLVNGLIPRFYAGELTGQVLIDGKDIADLTMYKIAEKVGSVFQNPRTQFFNTDSDSEIAFGLENQGMPTEELRQRVETTAADLEIQSLRNRSLHALSGGEKQKVAFASVYAMNPDIYLLDEPSSNLDVDAIQDLRKHLKLVKQQGKTILIAEHGSKDRITEREYWAQKKGQAKLDKENATLAAEGQPAKQTKFETDKAKLRQTIRNAMSEATTFDEFSALLLRQGVIVKESRGRLSYLTPDRTKPITARKLGDDFDRAAVLALLEQNAHRAAEKTAPIPEYHTAETNRTERGKTQKIAPTGSIQRMVDRAAKRAEGKGIGYDRWAAVHNLKQMAATVAAYQQYGFSSPEELDAAFVSANADLHSSTAKLKPIETAIREKKDLQKQVLAYAKTRDVRDGLKKQKTDKARKAYREKHESDFIIADAAVRYFRQKGITKLPTYKSLQAEIEQLTAEKNALYNEYRANKERVRELQTMKSNLSQMHHGEPSRQKKHEQER